MQQIQRYFRKAGKAILRFFGRVAHGSVLDIAILVCGVGLVGVGATIAVVSSQKPQQLPVDVSSASSMPVSSSVSIPPVEQEPYDPNENALQSSEYDGTLLVETADGGEAYLEETIFLGDSNTYRLATYGLTSWQNNLSAVGMGIQHVTSTPSMYFKGMSNPVYMARAVAMMQPRRIVITYGTNNTSSSVETFINQYRSALEAIKKEWPYADIIINAVPPVAVFRSNAANTQKSIDAFNKALANLAKEDGYQFLNSSEVLKDPATGFARTDYMIGDGLHLNEDGAKALISYVRTHTHIVADTRPTLSERPIHQPTPEELFNPQAASPSSSSSSSSSAQAEGVTVRFFITSGQESLGTLAGALTQVVEPGKTCTPVTATANGGCSIAGWGCTEGGLYEGQGLSAVVNNQQTATFTVPAGTSLKELSVWVSFSQHVHTYASNDWKMQDETYHAHWCTDPNCPAEDKGAVREAHTWPANDTTNQTIQCAYCEATKDNPNWKEPEHEHTPGSNWVQGETTHYHTCSSADCPDPNWRGDEAAHSYENGTCKVCGKADPNWKEPEHEHTPGSNWVQGETTHYHTCSSPDCPDPNWRGNEAAHSYENGACTVCGKADPNPLPAPEPQPNPDPTPDPGPEPNPEPDPTPSSDPTPDPDPTPSSDPTPDPDPTSDPDPTP